MSLADLLFADAPLTIDRATQRLAVIGRNLLEQFRIGLRRRVRTVESGDQRIEFSQALSRVIELPDPFFQSGNDLRQVLQKFASIRNQIFQHMPWRSGIVVYGFGFIEYAITGWDKRFGLPGRIARRDWIVELQHASVSEFGSCESTRLFIQIALDLIRQQFLSFSKTNPAGWRIGFRLNRLKLLAKSDWMGC